MFQQPSIAYTYQIKNPMNFPNESALRKICCGPPTNVAQRLPRGYKWLQEAYVVHQRLEQFPSYDCLRPFTCFYFNACTSQRAKDIGSSCSPYLLATSHCGRATRNAGAVNEVRIKLQSFAAEMWRTRNYTFVPLPGHVWHDWLNKIGISIVSGLTVWAFQSIRVIDMEELAAPNTTWVQSRFPRCCFVIC